MKRPDIPQDEQSRIETLQSLNILDSLHEERFDRLTRMAVRLFGVPIALVSLVDENRQWFKSCVGLDVSETPRDISFCGHAILEDDVFKIPDAQQDERFADNPLVTGAPDIRFYAGCTLKAPNGQALGTLCIIDQKPRDLDDHDMAALRDLASIAESELAAVQLATMDELTDITNRRGFMEIARYGLRFCARTNTPACLAFLDLDKLKHINDTFGHAEGDRVIADFADRMKNTFRRSDIFARLGGDEFAALLTNTPKQVAADTIARFRQELENDHRAGNAGYDLSFSYGIVEFDPEKHLDIESLLADGDALMYKQKKARNNP